MFLSCSADVISTRFPGRRETTTWDRVCVKKFERASRHSKFGGREESREVTRIKTFKLGWTGSIEISIPPAKGKFEGSDRSTCFLLV